MDRARGAGARRPEAIAERPLAQTSDERRRVESPWRWRNPKVLLFDEPFAGLSIDERRDVRAAGRHPAT
jgi:ABC-type branched-subunit amino acid transport system ATPase component